MNSNILIFPVFLEKLRPDSLDKVLKRVFQKLSKPSNKMFINRVFKNFYDSYVKRFGEKMKLILHTFVNNRFIFTLPNRKSLLKIIKLMVKELVKKLCLSNFFIFNI